MAAPQNFLNPDTGFIAVTRRFCKKKALFILSAACFLGASTAYSQEQPAEIITTLPPLAGLVKLLVTDSEPACLLPPGSDPHHFQLSPRLVEKLNRGKLLIRSSRDDYGWLKFTPKIPALDLWPEQDHAWLNPLEVEKRLPVLAEQLVALFPEKRMQIENQLKQAKADTLATRQALESTLQQLQSDGVIMQHPSWRRLFEAFGIPVLLTLESPQHGHEHGPHHLEEALEIVKQHPNALLIGDKQHSNRSLQWLADHAGGKKILYLDALGSCGDSWKKLMQDNVDRLQAR